MTRLREDQEEKLRKRLAEKRSKKMAELEQENVSQIQRLNMWDILEEEEKNSTTLMRTENNENEKKARNELKMRIEKDLAYALETSLKAQMDAAAAFSREQVLSDTKDAMNILELERNQTEVQKMKNKHLKYEKETNDNLTNNQILGKGKLQDRLAAKKLKKEAELKNNELKELNGLKERQGKEEIERENFKSSKLIWFDKLEKTVKKAEDDNYGLSETEDYCFREILDQNLVPTSQLSEAVEMIKRKKHIFEMSNLLTNHLNVRLSTIKESVRTVLDEKAKARMELMTKIKNENSDLLLLRLEEHFGKLQNVAESDAIKSLTAVQTKEQISLKQKQFEEIESIVRTYARTDVAAEVHNNNKKDQIKEITEYELKLIGEKRIREELSVTERNLTEKKLRSEMALKMQELKESLISEQSNAEKEFDEKKKELLKQREELESKQINEKELLNKQEKDRILSEFEKEKKHSLELLENSKRNQKIKLADRLAAKRKSKNIVSISIPVVENEKKSHSSLLSGEKMGKLKRRGSSNQFSESMLNMSTARLNVDFNLSQSPTPSLSKSRAQITRDSSSSSTLQNYINNNNNTNTNNNNNNNNNNINTHKAMKLIESKLENIERMIVAIEIKAEQINLPIKTPPLSLPLSLPLSSPLSPPVTEENLIGNSAPTTSTSTSRYRDTSEPSAGKSVKILPDSAISGQDKARLEFGYKLANMIGLTDIRLRAATELPTSLAENNTFSNSYHYLSDENVLLLHTDRLTSSGDVGLVLLHAFSHIKVSHVLFCCL